ncbi:hypothetical protein [Singulisphaera sp. GP187]|uniref:hypothetical protein n=1 Tax=Singulisphaera sp. GP187 TaxID=1882752 RepID=UPI0020B1534C|nr:hypothetical protein [Singulisphaera sp. GP187]
MIPPILIGLSSLIGAARGYANDRQERMHKRELHQLEIADAKKKRSALPHAS